MYMSFYGPGNMYRGTPLSPKYISYNCMEPLGTTMIIRLGGFSQNHGHQDSLETLGIGKDTKAPWRVHIDHITAGC